jgi:hypothetical protein
VAFWTISAQAGTGGAAIAAELARRADVPFLDRDALVARVHELEPRIHDAAELEARLSGGFAGLALGAAIATGAPEAVRELQLRKELPDLGRVVMQEVARHPGVVLAAGAFAALPDHPAAIHVRLRAAFGWRVSTYQRQEVVDRREAEKAVRHDDDQRRAWVKALYHVEIDDSSCFGLVVDVSRFASDRVAELLLAAAGEAV